MRAEQHLQPGCPWYELSELRLPNVDWCEAQRCALVVEPANTWSNLAYVAVGLLLIWLARSSASRQLRFFGPAAILVGLCSGIYHASYTFTLQVLDFFAMYVFCYLLITVNLRRLGRLPAELWWRRFWQLVVATTVVTVGIDFLEIPIQGIVFALILVIVGTEALAHRRDPDGSLRFFFLSLALLCTAGTFSALDVTRTWCDPEHPVLQGHAIWHVLTALALLAAYFHARQFEDTLR